MPYIDAKARDEMDRGGLLPDTPGELNYVITDLIDSYLHKFGDKMSYGAINEVIGVLECAKLELYRRIAAPYEQMAMLRNGDVYSDAVLTKSEDQP